MEIFDSDLQKRYITSMATREQLRKSARNKLTAAEKLADQSLPVEVSYLCMVAIECALKRKILSQNGFRRHQQFSDDEDHRLYTLFHGKSGHDLDRLYRMAKEKLSPCTSWTRMKQSNRPYSLRYNEENVSVGECREDLTFTREIVTRLEEEQ